jgi:hypothetical protein
VIRRKGRLWHRRGLGFAWMLNESCTAMLLDRSQSGGPVTIPTTQNNANDALSIGFGCGEKQGIGGGAGVVDLRPVAQASAVSLQQQVPIGWRHIDVARHNRVTLLSEARWKSRAAQEKREDTSIGANMHDNEYRRSAPVRQRGDDIPKRLKSAGRSCNYYNGIHVRLQRNGSSNVACNSADVGAGWDSMVAGSKQAGRQANPSAGVIDSQSMKTRRPAVRETTWQKR